MAQKVFGKKHTPSSFADMQNSVLPTFRTVVTTREPLATASRKTQALQGLGYFPSMAAHGALGRPISDQNITEIIVLRKTAEDREAIIRDLSSRLMKVKMAEVQSRPRSVQLFEGGKDSTKPEENQQEKPGLANIPCPKIYYAPKTASTTFNNQHSSQVPIAPTKTLTVPPFPLAAYSNMQVGQREIADQPYCQQQYQGFTQQSQVRSYQGWTQQPPPRRPTRVVWRWGRFWEI